MLIFWIWFTLDEFSMMTKTPSRALKRGRLRNLNVKNLFKKRRIILSPGSKAFSYWRPQQNTMHSDRLFPKQLNIYAT